MRLVRDHPSQKWVRISALASFSGGVFSGYFFFRPEVFGALGQVPSAWHRVATQKAERVAGKGAALGAGGSKFAFLKGELCMVVTSLLLVVEIQIHLTAKFDLFTPLPTSTKYGATRRSARS